MTRTRRRFLAQTAAATACGLPMMMRSPVAAADQDGGGARRPRKIQLDDARLFAELKEQFELDYPGMELGVLEIDGQARLRAEHGGMRVFWIYRGQGEIHLPAGYRTQEGGPGLLPVDYEPDSIDPAFRDLLHTLREALPAISSRAAPHVRAILARWQGGVYLGDFTVELWNLEHVPRPWSEDEHVEAALVSLFDIYPQVGYSTKQADSFEPVVAGDQIVACAAEQIAVRGRFSCLTMEKTDRSVSHISTARRLRYLVDTAGGCSFDFDPFRRLPLTWYMDRPGARDDGLNFVNSHVVNIPRELSSTHFHPRRPLLGGLPQAEMYLVLDPRAAGLEPGGREASILLFPDLQNLNCYEQHRLQPGDFVYIPPGVGHRGLDVFVNVLTVPGFKPHNEIYIDQDIRDRTGGGAPYNENGLERKNYDRLEDFL
jgi:hypothetical protein